MHFKRIGSIVAVLIVSFGALAQLRVREIQTSGTENKREAFRYFGDLLSGVDTYDSNNNLIRHLAFTYDEDLRIVGADDSQTGYTWSIIYSGKRISQITEGYLLGTSGFLFQYDHQDKIKLIRILEKDKLIGSWKYTFQNSDLYSIQFNLPRRSPLHGRIRKYGKLDGRQNYLKLLTSLLNNQPIIVAIFFGEEVWCTSNPFTRSESDKKGNDTIATDFTYEYNEAGFPIVIESIGGESVTRKRIFYSQ